MLKKIHELSTHTEEEEQVRNRCQKMGRREDQDEKDKRKASKLIVYLSI